MPKWFALCYVNLASTKRKKLRKKKKEHEVKRGTHHFLWMKFKKIKKQKLEV